MNTLDTLLKDFNKEEALKETWVDLEDYVYDLDIQGCAVYVENMDECKIEEYWLKSWICTDTMVGLKAHYLDDKLVAVSYQSGRKCDRFFYWTSVEDAIAMKSHIQYLIGEGEWKSRIATIEEDSQLEAAIAESIEMSEEYNQ